MPNRHNSLVFPVLGYLPVVPANSSSYCHKLIEYLDIVASFVWKIMKIVRFMVNWLALAHKSWLLWHTREREGKTEWERRRESERERVWAYHWAGIARALKSWLPCSTLHASRCCLVDSCVNNVKQNVNRRVATRHPECSIVAPLPPPCPRHKSNTRSNDQTSPRPRSSRTFGPSGLSLT